MSLCTTGANTSFGQSIHALKFMNTLNVAEELLTRHVDMLLLWQSNVD